MPGCDQKTFISAYFYSLNPKYACGRHLRALRRTKQKKENT